MINFGVINNAITLSKRLNEVAKKVNNAEITSIAADLMLELAETKMELANAKTEQQGLIESFEELKKERSKVYHENNKYFSYVESDILYCTRCYDSKDKLITLFQNDDDKYYCPECLNRRRLGAR